MPIQMPALPKTFGEHLREMDASRANDQQAELNALRIDEARRGLRDDQTVRSLMQQYGTDYGQMAGAAAAAGVGPDTVASLYDRANAVEERTAKKKSDDLDFAVKGLEYVQATAPRITDQAGWDAALQDWQTKGLVNPGELPAEFKPEHVQRLAKRADQKLKTISYQTGDQKVTELLDEETGERTPLGSGPAFKPERPPKLREIYDPESPTGTRLVPEAEAVGNPGKPAKGGISITGYDEQGRPLLEVGGSGMGTAAKNKVEGDLLSGGETLSALTAIRSRFRPEFQTLGTRLGVAWDRMRDRLNPASLTEQERGELDAFTRYRSEAAQLFSNTLKSLSGAAVTPHEMKRAEAWLPNPGTGMLDGDSPAELQAKVDRFEQFTRKALAKSSYVRRHGLTPNDLDVDEMPRLMQKRGDDLMGEYRAQGVPEEEAKRATKLRLADEFGLGAY